MANSGWKKLTLGELVDAGKAFIQTGPFGTQLHSYDYTSIGVPVVPTEAIGWRRLIGDGVPRISAEKADELSRHRLKPGDILFATGIPIDQVLEVLMEKYEIVQGILHGFDFSKFFSGKASERVGVIPEALDFILQHDDGQFRFVQAVTELSKAFALVATHEKAEPLREEIAFFQCLRAQFAKLAGAGDAGGPSKEDLDAAVRQIISKSVASSEVIDIFAAAGMDRPDISILSDEFLAEVRDMPQRNLALEVLRKLLSDDIKARSRKNLVQSRSFAEMLEKTIKKYQNRSIDAAQVIAELVALAKEMREARQRGESLGLTEDEEAFYEALEVNDSAVAVLGDKALCTIARELVDIVRRNVTIDWTVKDSVRAKLRVMVKKILKKHGYPPDKQAQATETVLKQAELLCADWAA